MEKQGRKTIPITPSLRLVPYYPAYETTLPWYQDAELCHQVDNQNRIYDLSILKNMYEYLNAHGDLFYIEYEGTLCEIYSFNAQSQAMFRSIGFVQKDAEMFVYPLR